MTLVLTRRGGESILIGDDIEIKVVPDQHGRPVKVRLAITAPGRLVLRKEVADDPSQHRPLEKRT